MSRNAVWSASNTGMATDIVSGACRCATDRQVRDILLDTSDEASSA